ncbi:Uncharacterized protein Adt_40001 [Abeliophyllum distichum]|uniref:Uncharacterized protein n=1 Tax=Abeliophyllum distichum TaxID=126358 RepID=A0ABD1Q6W4_9LAMI
MGEIAVLQPQDILKNQPNRRHRNNLIKRSKKPIKSLAGSVPAKVSRRKRRSAKDLVVPTSAGLLGPLPKKLSKQKETHNFYAWVVLLYIAFPELSSSTIVLQKEKP